MLNHSSALATVARCAIILSPHRSPIRPQMGPHSEATRGLQLRINPLQKATPAFDVMPSSRTNEGRNGITSVYPKKINAADIVIANWFLRHWIIGEEEPEAGQVWTWHPGSCLHRS